MDWLAIVLARFSLSCLCHAIKAIYWLSYAATMAMEQVPPDELCISFSCYLFIFCFFCRRRTRRIRNVLSFHHFSAPLRFIKCLISFHATNCHFISYCFNIFFIFIFFIHFISLSSFVSTVVTVAPSASANLSSCWFRCFRLLLANPLAGIAPPLRI